MCFIEKEKTNDCTSHFSKGSGLNLFEWLYRITESLKEAHGFG